MSGEVNGADDLQVQLLEPSLHFLSDKLNDTRRSLAIERRKSRSKKKRENNSDIDDFTPEELSFSDARNFYNQEKYREAREIYLSLAQRKPEMSTICESLARRCAQLITDDSETNASDHAPENSDFAEIFKNEDSGWSAVITMWKRTDYLEEQLEALFNQTIPPDQIIILQNGNHFVVAPELVTKYGLQIIRSDVNSLYTRWIVGYLCDSEYICVLDDDVIPGRHWIELCINTSKEGNALVGPSGRKAALDNKDRAWDSVENLGKDEALECDWVCNAYFFKKEWIKYIVGCARYNNTQKTFDDIQLATTLKQNGGIKAMVPPQRSRDGEWSGHTKRQYGHDEHALWKRNASLHLDERRKFIQEIDDAGFEWS
ncbi:hypothetical protein R84981_001415 [Carnimonas sp. R-84981]|uniref:glycosyltransferase family 2 protein n=1 Tax=Carnimonas bestiolae TaxID=3402172 RepID=UPI003EDBCD49